MYQITPKKVKNEFSQFGPKSQISCLKDPLGWLFPGPQAIVGKRLKSAHLYYLIMAWGQENSRRAPEGGIFLSSGR